LANVLFSVAYIKWAKERPTRTWVQRAFATASPGLHLRGVRTLRHPVHALMHQTRPDVIDTGVKTHDESSTYDEHQLQMWPTSSSGSS
jgi:hypothetical protein